MNTIKTRFHFHLGKLESLIDKSAIHENHSLWLFLNDLRTPMFMLEGLCKIYKEISDEKLFINLKQDFKLVEDALGKADHYVAMYKTFESNTKVNDEVKDYFYNKAQEKIWLLNELLYDDHWLDGEKIKKIYKKIKPLNDLSLEKENAAIIGVFKDEIAEIIEFVKDDSFTFEDMEHDVHELRRKLRWLSIYAHALNGVIQLAPSKNVGTDVKKYLSESVLSSPYNVLPVNKEKLATINIDKNSFYALSWLIAELGKIKDQGLIIHALAEAFQETNFDKSDVALEKAYKILGNKQTKMDGLLKLASDITKNYIVEGHLEKLLLS
jgi:hypothetical protein